MTRHDLHILTAIVIFALAVLVMAAGT